VKRREKRATTKKGTQALAARQEGSRASAPRVQAKEHTENVEFWHHQQPAVPLGHNYSNPSHKGST
jgi:hypothetical protein